ncbi:transposase family protein [Streptomyces desertarenae]|uniref:Transposase family protein n=1 Tax=Streptomyces desertarenae TaxID=2666184 RepID=A0ABW4PP71_9ACTN
MGAGAKHRLVSVDRLLATLVHLYYGTTHDVSACWFGVDRSTITRAVGEVRILLAERGCTVAPGVRLRTLAAVIDRLGANSKTGIIDSIEIRVRRPAAGRRDREAFISGTSKRNAVKPMAVTDDGGRVLCCSPTRQLRGHHPRRQLDLVKFLADGAAVELRRRRLPGTGRAERRARGHPITPQGQEERSGLVREDGPAAAHGAFLAAHPRRARHRLPEESARPDLPRAVERLKPSSNDFGRTSNLF